MTELSKQELDKMVDSIKIDKANMEHIAKTGIINGTLLTEIWRMICTSWAMGMGEVVLDAWKPGIKAKAGNKRADFLHKGICLDTGKEVIGTPIFNHLGCFLVSEENPHVCHENGFMEIDDFHRVDPDKMVKLDRMEVNNG